MCSNFETAYVSCGCNKSPHCADWGRNGLIAFGSCGSVAIYDPSISSGSGKIIHTLHGHKGKVNSVRWLRNFSERPENELVSASADGTCIFWSYNRDKENYVQEAVLTGHSNIVNVADGLVQTVPRTNYIPNVTPVIIATASVDSTVRIYRRKEDGGMKCVDEIDWNSGFCVDVRLVPLPETKVTLLACAAEDNNVHLFVEVHPPDDEPTSDHEFEKVYTIVGHDDWVRSLDFIIDVYNDLYLATGSQDTYVRIYKLHLKGDEAAASRSKKSINLDEIEPQESLIRITDGSNELNFSITLETILAGHEGWVYGVCWHPPVYKTETGGMPHGEALGSIKTQKIQLLSVSMDKTMIIWSPDLSGIWTEEARLGEVGGSSLGFYGGKFGEGGLAIMGHGYLGSFHIWRYDQENKNWEPSVVVGGHTAEVMDMTWDAEGNYILSVGADQTTRLHAPWVRNEDCGEVTWHELSRPQIHGHDMTCIAPLGKYKYASGAEEKVIRAFSAPSNFIANFRRISRISEPEEGKGEDMPQGAAVPALGLSNKPVFEELRKEGFLVGDEYPDLYFSPIYLKKPPTEENLMQNTLWPESQKLYGHGFEIYSLAARGDGVVLASSCKATSPEHAAILLWNAKTWLLLQKLISHQLTVTQLCFSPDGKYLLSVSRDRRWSLFNVTSDGKTYELATASDSKNGLHQRIIWCCAWTYDSQAFATGSRDGKIGFWSFPDHDPRNVKLMTSLELGKDSVTALAFTPILRRGYHVLAVGLENGSISLYRYMDTKVENLWVVFQGHLGHQLTVKRLAFRPKLGRTGVSPNELHNSNVLQLASCGADHIIKVYDVYLHLL